MKRLKKLPGSSVAGRRRLLIYIVGFVITLTVVVVAALRPVRYELEATESDIDFTAPNLPVHTAEDGVAVVRPRREPVSPAPPEAWADNAAVTHSGFSLPVSMGEDDHIGVLTVPDLDLSVRVYESEDTMEAMRAGAAHFKHTSAWEGNIGISAHNINLDGTAGYFRDLHLLHEGAVIRYDTADGTRDYAVTGIAEIAETDWSALTRTGDNRLTLITCISGSPEKRLCVQAAEIKG